MSFSDDRVLPESFGLSQALNYLVQGIPPVNCRWRKRTREKKWKRKTIRTKEEERGRGEKRGEEMMMSLRRSEKNSEMIGRMKIQ